MKSIFPTFFGMPTAQNLVNDLKVLVIDYILSPNRLVNKEYMDFVTHITKSALNYILFESDYSIIGLAVSSYQIFIRITNHSIGGLNFKIYVILNTPFGDKIELVIPYK